jgi:hypothetical protein
LLSGSFVEDGDFAFERGIFFIFEDKQSEVFRTQSCASVSAWRLET